MSSLKTKVLEDIKVAMKSKDEKALAALRFLNSGIKNKEIDIRPKQIQDQDVFSVIQKQVKQYDETIDQLKKANYLDQVPDEEFKRSVIFAYLPKQMSESESKSAIQKLIQDLGASSMSDMGKVMKQIKEQFGASIDAKLASQILRDELKS